MRPLPIWLPFTIILFGQSNYWTKFYWRLLSLSLGFRWGNFLNDGTIIRLAVYFFSDQPNCMVIIVLSLRSGGGSNKQLVLTQHTRYISKWVSNWNGLMMSVQNRQSFPSSFCWCSIPATFFSYTFCLIFIGFAIDPSSRKGQNFVIFSSLFNVEVEYGVEYSQPWPTAATDGILSAFPKFSSTRILTPTMILMSNFLITLSSHQKREWMRF